MVLPSVLFSNQTVPSRYLPATKKIQQRTNNPPNVHFIKCQMSESDLLFRAMCKISYRLKNAPGKGVLPYISHIWFLGLFGLKTGIHFRYKFLSKSSLASRPFIGSYRNPAQRTSVSEAEGQPCISEWACSFFASKLKGLFPFHRRMNTKQKKNRKKEREKEEVKFSRVHLR